MGEITDVVDEVTTADDERPNFGLLRRKTQEILKRLLEGAEGYKNFTNESRPMGRLFTQKEVEDMVGRSRTTLRKLEEKISGKIKKGEFPEDSLPTLDRNPETGRIVGYPFSWVQAFREEAGTLPWRDPEQDEPFVVSVIQFKGGVGKTETVSNLSRYLALQGYRILVIDMDHQGSCTGSFGFFPDMSFTEKDTVVPYIKGDEDTLHYAIHKTAWPNIDLIPGCMALEDLNWAMAEFAMKAESSEEKRELFYELRCGIDTVANNYDIIVIDSPPSANINSFEIIAATDGAIVPIPPRKHDLSSTEQFLGIVERLTRVAGQGGQQEEGIIADKKFKFLRFLITQFVNDGKRSTNDADFTRSAAGSMALIAMKECSA